MKYLLIVQSKHTNLLKSFRTEFAMKQFIKAQTKPCIISIFDANTMKPLKEIKK